MVFGTLFHRWLPYVVINRWYRSNFVFFILTCRTFPIFYAREWLLQGLAYSCIRADEVKTLAYLVVLRQMVTFMVVAVLHLLLSLYSSFSIASQGVLCARHQNVLDHNSQLVRQKDYLSLSDQAVVVKASLRMTFRYSIYFMAVIRLRKRLHMLVTMSLLVGDVELKSR